MPVCLGVKTTNAYLPSAVRPIARKRGSARVLEIWNNEGRRMSENVFHFRPRYAMFLTLGEVGLVPGEP